MDHGINVIHSIGIILILVLFAAFLKRIGILKEEDGGLFAKIITQYTIPALIFSAISSISFEPQKLLLALVTIIVQILSAIFALFASKLLRLNRSQTGALILGSTFSSSGFLGYAVIREIYDGNPDALSDAAVVSELGVATMIFTFGILIAAHFGTKKNDLRQQINTALKFFYSPILIALVAGIFFSFTQINLNNIGGGIIPKILHTIASANTLLVTLTIGVMLDFRDFKKVWYIVLIAISIKLLIQPLLTNSFANMLQFPPLWQEIAVLEASMPTAALTAVFARQFDCDAELSSALVFTSFISSIFTIFGIIFFLS